MHTLESVPIHGTIEEAGLPDVLHLLTLGQKTGCLSIADGEDQGEIFLEAGRICFAQVAVTTSRSEDARRQVEEAVYHLLSLKQGAFTFTSKVRPPNHAVALSLDPETLLLEGARRVDEWGQIQRKIPSFDLVYQRCGSGLGLAAARLTDNQERILPLLDGLHDVWAVLELSGMSKFDVGKALYGLTTAGFIQVQERRLRVRHLEYREVLAFVVGEAEFADQARRVDAERHFAECTSCAERLENIHVRRTGEMIAAPVMAQAVGAETVSALTLHVQDRRARDRRLTERRGVLDRRHVMTASWTQVHAERRLVLRRAVERRGTGRSRRSSDVMRTRPRVHPAPTLQLSPPAAPPAPPAPPPVLPPKKIEMDPVLPRQSSSELVWLTTPEESMEMVRRDSRMRIPASMPAPATVPVHRPHAPSRARPTAIAWRRRQRIKVVAALAAVAGLGLATRYGMLRVSGDVAPPASAPPAVVAPVDVAPPVAVPAAPAALMAGAAPRAETLATTRTPAPAPAPSSAPAPEIPPATPDEELAAGGWTAIDRAEAMSMLGGTLAAVPGLRIESITTSSVGGRARVRLAQLDRTGERLVLTQMPSGEPPVAGARPRVTGVVTSQITATQAMGTASLGPVFVTARSTLGADALRPLLQRLAPVR